MPKNKELVGRRDLYACVVRGFWKHPPVIVEFFKIKYLYLTEAVGAILTDSVVELIVWVAM